MSALARVTAAVTVVIALAGGAPAAASVVSAAAVGAVNPPATLTYLAGPGELNDLTVATIGAPEPTAWLVSDAGATVTAGTGCTSLGPHTASCTIAPAANGVAVRADLRDSDDRASMAGACGPEANAACRNVVVDMGSGDDVALGADGTRTGLTIITGGPGDDRLGAGRSGAQLFGRRGDDVVVGGQKSDDLEGGPGRDIVRGKSGRDMVRGGWGDDVVQGGDDNDTVAGGPGRDVVRGGHGNDFILAGHDGADRIDGGAGSDTAHLQRRLDHWTSIEHIR